MKRMIAAFLAGALLLTAAACKRKPSEPAAPDTPVDYIDFRANTEEMTPESAADYLQSEEADVSTPEYRRAVYTVNESAATDIIAEAQEQETQTDAVKTLFEGVPFRFIEGDQFGSETIRKKLMKEGTWELHEDGYYYFSFYDRTLPQVAANLKRDHALEEYRRILELLLQDPNVQVKTIEP